jgi:hypothetical protein
VSDPFDGDPDDFFESDEEESLSPDNPAEEYEEGTLGTAVPQVPSPEVPDVETDSDTLADYGEVDPGLRRRFWVLVLAIKFTLLSLTLGLLFYFFEGNTMLGGQLLGFTVLLTAYTIYRYRDTKHRFESTDSAGDDEAADAEEDGTDAAAVGADAEEGQP